MPRWVHRHVCLCSMHTQAPCWVASHAGIQPEYCNCLLPEVSCGTPRFNRQRAVSTGHVESSHHACCLGATRQVWNRELGGIAVVGQSQRFMAVLAALLFADIRHITASWMLCALKISSAGSGAEVPGLVCGKQPQVCMSARSLHHRGRPEMPCCTFPKWFDMSCCAGQKTPRAMLLLSTF